MFENSAEPIPEELRLQMTGRSWRPGMGCAEPDDLVLLRMTHWGFDGRVHEGEMVIAAEVADEVVGAFERIFEARFPIERMRLIHHYGGDDHASMADNNSSAFNCRPVIGGAALSQHALGLAIDLNPVQNPYVTETVLPPAGADYLDRDDVRKGMVVRPGPVTRAFDEVGWSWGGDWERRKDYQHFSKTGR